MKIPIYQIDAFTGQLFGGNPAAVCPLDAWLDERVMQQIAAENNVAETAFLVGGSGRYQIRWFTPAIEVPLCGHATVASAYVVFNELERGRTDVTFSSKSGPLPVHAEGDRIVLDFPALPPRPCEPPQALLDALGAAPREVYKAAQYLAVYERERDVRALEPNLAPMHALDTHGAIVTAPGESVDFVSRFFAPNAGVPEDPVTGSAHCTLTPYWAKRLRKTSLHALQVSARGGELWCELRGDRVHLGGRAVKYLEGVIEVLGDQGARLGANKFAPLH